MIKNRNLFVELDESFSETAVNANKTDPKVLGKGTVEFTVTDSRENLKKVSMSDSLYVPENSKKLVSITKLTRGGAKVALGEKSCFEQENGTIHPLRERGNLFLTYFCRETEEKIENFTEQNENLMINDAGKMEEVELKNESRAHPKTKTSLDERSKEESRNLCEAKMF